MSHYRYVVTNILTGALMADSVPLAVSSITRAINGVGTLDGYLDLQQGSPFVRALVPDQSFIWVLQNEYPIWCGIFADSDHRSIRDHQYPIKAYTPESIFASRQIRGALNYVNVDIATIARNLIAYGTSLGLGQNAQIAGLMLGSRLFGVLDSQTFGVSNTLLAGGNTYTGSYTDNQAVSDAVNTYADAANFEYTFEPQLNNGELQVAFRLGYPALGRYNSPAITLLHPGQVLDYGRPVMRSQAANDVQGTAAANGTGATFVSQPGYGLDTNDLAQGNILRQTAVTWSGTGPITQAQVNTWTQSQVARFTAGTMVPTIVLGGGTQPSLTQLGLGDAFNFAATSDLDPALPGTGAPGLQLTARMVGWSLQPPGPGGQAEELTITAGALVGATGIGGVGTP